MFRKSNKDKAEKKPAADKKAAKKQAAADKKKAAEEKKKAKAAGKAAVGAAYRRSEVDVYTVLLVVALLAMLTGIAFLCLEMQIYNWEFKGGPRAGMIVGPLSAAASWLPATFGL